ncbi:choice-of-anchor B family protein [Polaribacter sp. KT 15]|uniref:choice-of-anchor B family protein n=1 Tax=Polaribacter sp. KT 15 TaxID=1896175 RepID=UPI00090A3F4B|nr:choice-of-anchor B family protein [Polaribacter sp. KT 15]SHM91597.1 choice-of-anchor B domain-containing protein [Polaribacter sp. KT 15]
MIKKTFFIFVLIIVSCSKKEVVNQVKQTIINPIAKCEDGFAGEFPCNDYDLLTHITLDEIAGENTQGNDSWGWVDPVTNNEYAIVCTNKGTSFIDITNPADAKIIGFLKTRTENSLWRDVKVYNDFAFIVSEADNHGMQIFNLNNLRGLVNIPVEFTADRDFTSFGSAHNIVINEDTGYAYPVGTSRSATYKGGPLFININNPFKPVNEGGFEDYAHDAQAVTYNGPDSDYSGREILIGSNETEVVIADVTDKQNPVKISSISYSNIGYTHQGWFTKDFKYFILGDELDERDKGLNTRTIVFDFTDLDNPKHHFDYSGPTAAIDHNGYVKDNLFFQASYTAGVRIIDISNIDAKSFTEVGFFDTYPENDNTAFNGAWNVYPYLPSGNIIISDINRGLFVIRKSKT